MGITGNIVVLVSCVAVLTGAQRNPCPTAASIKPCTCDYAGINCLNVTSSEELRVAFSSPGPKEHRGLWIQRTPIRTLAPGTLGKFVFVKVFVDLNKDLEAFDLDTLDASHEILTELSLYGNGLSRIDFKNLHKYMDLESLNLGSNKIRTLSANAFSNSRLTKLILRYNPLEVIDAFAFNGLVSLVTLDVRNTHLRVLGENSMSMPLHSPSLMVLLEDGRIERIHPDAFANTSPYLLKLSRNNMTSLPMTVFRPLMVRMLRNSQKLVNKPIPKVYTQGNPFTCRGCEYSWLTRFPQRNVLDHIFYDFKCADNTRLLDLTGAMTGCP